MNSNPTSPNMMTKNIQTFRYKLSDEIIEKLVHFSKIHQYDDIHQFKMYWNNWIQTDNMSVIIKNEENSLKQKYFSGDLKDKMFKSARYYYRKKQIKIEEQSTNTPTNTPKKKSSRLVGFVEPIMNKIRQTVDTCQSSLNTTIEYQDKKETFEINGAENGVGRINDESVAGIVSCKHITPSSKIIIANEKTHSNIQSSTNTEESISTITLSIFSEESTPISTDNSSCKLSDNSSYASSTDSKGEKIKLSKQLLQHIDNHINNIFKKDTEINQRIQISPAIAYSQFCINYKEEIANEICYILKNSTIPIQPEKLSSRLKKTYKNRFFKCIHCL